MRVVLGAAVLSVMLGAAPVFAQTPAAAQPAPAQPAPAQPAQPPRPFPEGAKIAYMDIQRIANESTEGRASTAKVKALNDKKVAELAEKNKSVQAKQQKLVQGGTVLSDSARAQLEKEIERDQVDIQRFTQDAQAEVQDLQQTLQLEFQRRLMPVIGQVAAEKGLQMILSRGDAGIIWADNGLDITAEVIKRFDTGGASGTTGAPVTKPPETKPPVR